MHTTVEDGQDIGGSPSGLAGRELALDEGRLAVGDGLGSGDRASRGSGEDEGSRLLHLFHLSRIPGARLGHLVVARVEILLLKVRIVHRSNLYKHGCLRELSKI